MAPAAESPGPAGAAPAPRRRRLGAMVATAAVITGVAVTSAEFTGSAEPVGARAEAVTCSLWAVNRPTLPIASEEDPVAFDGKLLPGTAGCTDPAGEISGVSYWMEENAKGLASCTGMEVTDAVVRLDWVMTDGSSQSGSLRIGKLTLSEEGPLLEDATVEGGPESVAGKAATVSASQETVDAAKAAAATQCATGGVKNLVGTVEVHFG